MVGPAAISAAKINSPTFWLIEGIFILSCSNIFFEFVFNASYYS
jgi:hypothetical protein